MTDATRSRPHDREGIVVALDGPASSGKSTVGAAAASALGFGFLDTGLLYRGLTWLAQQLRVPLDVGESVAELVPRVTLRAGADRRYDAVHVDGLDVTDEVLTSDVDRSVSEVARQPEVRAALLARQREMAGRGDIVVAGRDIGTVVLPDADVKIFLEASAEERARRRAAQRGVAPGSPEAEAILADLRARDEVDRNRPTAPLRPAWDATTIVTDGATVEETIAAVTDAIRAVQARRAEDLAADARRSDQLAEAERAALDLARSDVAAVGAFGAAEEPMSRPGDEPAAPKPEPERAAPPRPRPAARPRAKPAGPPLSDEVTPFIRLTDLVGRTIMTSLTRVHIEGLEEPLDIDGPLIVASNHASNADGPLVVSWLTPALGRKVHLLGKQEAVDWPLFGWALQQNGVIGVERGAADLEAFRAAKRVLDEGHVLGIFPEGTRSRDGRLQEAKDGAALLALKTGARILPVGLSNTYRFWPRHRKLFRPGGHVRMRVGTPFSLPTMAGVERRRAPAEATRLIMTRIAELLPPGQRGAYAAEVDRLRGE